MSVLFSNNASTTLSAGVGNSATSITVADGSVFPAISGGDYFYVTLEVDSDPDLKEIVKCTARSGNTLTIVRAQDGTSARTFSTADKCELRLTAAGLNDVATQADTDTTYSIGDGGLTQNNFTDALKTKLDGTEASADVTDTTNVTAAGALMDSEVTNLAQVKAFDSADYATAAQGTTADAALPKAGGALTGAVTTTSTFDGRDVATDGTKLDGIEAGATADQTAAEILTAIKTVDGSGSGLDADTVDGVHGSSFLRSNADDSFSNTITGNKLYLGGSQITNSTAALQVKGFQRTGTIYLHEGNTAVAGNNWALATTSSGELRWNTNKVWTAASDGSGSGLDADLLDGQHGSYYAPNSSLSSYLPLSGGAMTGAITTNSTFDGRDVATDGTKLDGIEASADVTDTTNVTAAGALMDSEVTNLAQVKAFDSSDYATAAQADQTVALTGAGTTSISGTYPNFTITSTGGSGGNETLAQTLALGNTTGGTDLEVSTGDSITLPDAAKIKLGDEPNLEIYHSGSHSFIEDVGGGSLFIKGGPQLKLMNDNETAVLCQKDGAVTLYHNNSAKVATTSSGINVKGNLDMASDSTTSARYVNLPRGGGITFYGNGSADHSITSRNSGDTVTDDLFMQSYGGIFLGLDSNNNNSSSADFKIVTNGNSTARLTFSGENYGLTVSGNVTAYSDARLKENVELIPDALEKVQKLRGVTFTRNDHKDTERRHVGVIAQEVEAVLPEAVWDGEDGIKNVAYGNMVGLLIEAVKELKAEVEELKGNA